MSRVGQHFAELTTTIFGLALIAVYLLLLIGWLYWIWIAIQVGSFAMFVVGLVPPLQIMAAPMGAWCFLFGVPDWMIAAFDLPI